MRGLPLVAFLWIACAPVGEDTGDFDAGAKGGSSGTATAATAEAVYPPACSQPVRVSYSYARVGSGLQLSLQFPTSAGLQYVIQSSTTVTGPYADVDRITATGTTSTWTTPINTSEPSRFFLVKGCTVTPCGSLATSGTFNGSLASNSIVWDGVAYDVTDTRACDLVGQQIELYADFGDWDAAFFSLYAMPSTGALTTVTGTPSSANQLSVSAYRYDKYGTALSGRTAYLGYPTTSSLELCFENMPVSFDITTTGIVSGRVTCSGW